MEAYNFKEIEKKWQDKWQDEPAFKAVDFHPTKPKYYILYEFFNVSGGLHMGHLKGTVPSDALARMKRFQGYNVLFPIGGDAFGLPAENAAIKAGVQPQQFVVSGLENALSQTKRIGLSFDWSRTICTSDPEYYHWTQWIFLQLYKHGKAYKTKGYVNYCPSCKTVLSNEDSQGGKCDRCGSDVIQKERWVWFLKMNEYSEKLLGNVDRIQMAEHLKEAQRNWIGKSEGMQVSFKVVNDKNDEVGNFEIFTTCIETIYGITFMVLAPEHDLINKWLPFIKNKNMVEKYKNDTAKRSALDRMADQKQKTGCVLEGIFAVNPVNGKKVPIYIADFVLAGYGTGAVMAVPAHDQRDYEFAVAHNIPMIQVIEGDCSKCAVEKKEYLVNGAKLINSEEFSGLSVKEAKNKISQKLIEMKLGKKQINYKMTDWPFNRQRYWGEPFPIIFCPHCGEVPLTEKDLPLVLPIVKDYKPNEHGDSPLSKAKNWMNIKCPICGRDAVRESDTMPNWAGSSWYWLRYVDPHNDKCLADYEKLKYWGSVDVYTGGTEHITRHVLYAFFWQNFLYEIGAVPSRDPFAKKYGSGLLLDDQGKKMSKSSANGVSPMQVIDEYGADVARLHLHFLSGFEDNVPWTYNGISGITNFIDKVWNLQSIIKGEEVTDKHRIDLNRLIKKVTEDYEEFKPNTAIAAMMSFIKMIKEDSYISKEELRIFLILLNPMAPHITSEIYERVFGKNIVNENWPKFDPQCLETESVEIPVQINGKKARVITVNRNVSQEKLLELIKQKYPELFADGKVIKKVIYVPNKIINIIK